MRTKIFFCVFFLTTFFLLAQAPVQIIIHSSDNQNKTLEAANTKKGINGGFKNMVKWNLALLGRGVFMANYERVLNEHFTIEVGAGITYWDYFYMERYESHDCRLFQGNSSTQSLVTGLSEDATHHYGYALEVNPRFYFEKDEFEGFYVSGYASYRQYNFSLQEYETNSISGVSYWRNFDNLGYSIIDLGGKVGYQIAWRWNDAVYWDVYLGAAYRQVNMHTLLRTENSADYTYSEYFQAISMPSFMCGLKVGYAF